MEVPTFMAAIAFHRGDFPELHEQGEATSQPHIQTF
jgi:hypothetical protein